MFELPERNQNSNKGTFGKILNIAGSKNYIGAAYLSSLGALKIGAGYVALVSDTNVINAVSSKLPEIVFFDWSEGREQTGNFDVIIIGCGMGTGFNAQRHFKQLINDIQKKPTTTLIDADGLNIMAKLYSKRDFSILNFSENGSKNLIITPHPAEAGRLLGISTEEVLSNLNKAAEALCNRYNCTTVLKTHRTIVRSKEGELYINEHGNSALAKAGTGDVLAGIISGLLAQKMKPFEAAKLGVYLHSIAGEKASEELTEYSVLASDIPKYLPQAIKSVQNYNN